MSQLEELKIEYDLAKLDMENVKSKTARMGIHDALKNLKKKINTEETRFSNNLNKIEIDGVEYDLPSSFSYRGADKRNTYAEGNTFYFLDQSKKYDSDGSYHWWHYAWIPQREDKYVCLLVRTLGGDRYGDRFFIETTYYKHPADRYPYMTKHPHWDSQTYRPHIQNIINKLGLEFDKERRDRNGLKWIEGSK